MEQTTTVITLEERQRMAHTAALLAWCEKLGTAVKAKDKAAVLALYDEDATIDLEQVTTESAEAYEIMITLANDLLYA